MKFPLVESKNLEFKLLLEDYRRMAESVVAFANVQGGEVIVGIRDEDREVVGLSETQVLRYQEEIPQVLADQISPQLAVDAFARNIEGRVCFVVKVFPGPHKPYFISRLGYPRGIYLRYGSHNRPADDYAVRDLERQRNHASFEQQLNAGAGFEELSKHLLDRIVHGTSPETFVSCGYGALDADQKVKAYNSGVLLFHEKPSVLIPEAYLTITRFSGATTSAIANRESFSGTVVEQYEGALEHLSEATGRDFALYDGKMVPRSQDYPQEAVRELLVNALVHRAYDFEAPIRVSLFSDRLEILNPGTFYAPINEHTLRDGLSRYRNPAIAQAFRKLNYMEKQGIGINRIFACCAEAGLPEPQFLELEHYVKVVLYKDRVPDNMVRTQPTVSYGTGSSEAGYIEIVRTSERLTSRELAQRIGKSQAMAKKILNSLVRRGLVKMVGKARATHYVLDRG